MPTRTLRLALALCSLAGLAAPLLGYAAQPRRIPVTQASTTTIELTGRDFAGLQLGLGAQPGEVSLGGRNVTVWTEDPVPGPEAGTTIGGPVHRAVLVGDAEVTLGDVRFSAARAVVWIEQLGPSPADPKRSLHQVAVYFDRVSDPTASAGTAAAGDRLLVTAIVDGPVALRGDRTQRGRPGENEVVFVAEAEQRLARHLQDLLGEGELAADSADDIIDVAPVPGMRGRRGLVIPGLSQPYEPGSMYGDPDRPRTENSLLESSEGSRNEPLFTSRGLITIAAGEPTLLTGPAAAGENIVVVTGGVIVQYTDGRRERSLQISCERAVIFLKPGPLMNLVSSPAEAVEGLYLEGNVVATDGQYTLRGPQVFYDVKANKAMVMDAVFWTYDQQRGLPLYVRASSLRQLATNQFQGEQLRVSTSSFFNPTFSLGASDVTITRDVPPGQIARTILSGKDLTARFRDVPFFYWPSFDGDTDNIPLRDIQVENRSASGFGVRTRWDLFGLLGAEGPGQEWNAELLVDGFARRGGGLGTDLSWNTDNAKGGIFAYTLPYDSGTDVLSSGAEEDRDGMFRGLFLGEHRWQISENWTAFMELAAVSDANFVQAEYESLARTRREFTSSANLRRIEDNTLLSLMVRGNLNTFTPNQYLLQSQGYDVAKFPEITYVRSSDDVLSGIAPGVLTYSSEYRLSRMALNLTQKSPKALGFDTVGLSQDAFGIGDPNQIIENAREAQGFDENFATRFDTRHELSSPLDLGPVRLNPFVVTRFTGYDRQYSNFASLNGFDGDDSRYRAWAAAGLRASTSITRVYDDVNLQMLDIHRIRHIIEPSATLWVAGTNRPDGSLPIYDDRVEGINQGTTFRAGVLQTFQTQRGGEGRWRTVDVLKWDTNIVYSADNAEEESPIGRFIDYRPEYGQLGKFIDTDLIYQATDALAITGNTVYDFDENRTARVSAGLIWQQWSDLSFFSEVHYLNERDATYVTVGGDFRVTAKWRVGASTTYDVEESNMQGATLRLRREFPQVIMGANLTYNNITDEVGVGVEVIPTGRDYRLTQLRRLDTGALDRGFTEGGDAGYSEGPLGGGTGR